MLWTVVLGFLAVSTIVSVLLVSCMLVAASKADNLVETFQEGALAEYVPPFSADCMPATLRPTRYDWLKPRTSDETLEQGCGFTDDLTTESTVDSVIF